MKAFITIFTALALLITIPASAKEKTKRELKEEEAKKEKEAKAMEDAKKEYLFTAVIKPSIGDATDADVAKVKSLLSISGSFKTKEVALVDKQVVATLAVNTGRVSKSDVSRLLKDSKDTQYRIDRFEDVKPEKEKKDKDKDKPSEKKEEMKKEATKPTTPPAGTPPAVPPPSATPPAGTPPPSAPPAK